MKNFLFFIGIAIVLIVVVLVISDYKVLESGTCNDVGAICATPVPFTALRVAFFLLGLVIIVYARKK